MQCKISSIEDQTAVQQRGLWRRIELSYCFPILRFTTNNFLTTTGTAAFSLYFVCCGGKKKGNTRRISCTICFASQAAGTRRNKKSFVSFSMFAAWRRNSIDLQCNFLEDGSFTPRNMRLKTSNLDSNVPRWRFQLAPFVSKQLTTQHHLGAKINGIRNSLRFEFSRLK